MSRFFIRRPTVAMVIAVLTVVVGAVTIVQFPNIVPPEILLRANYPGADGQTLVRLRGHTVLRQNAAMKARDRQDCRGKVFPVWEGGFRFFGSSRETERSEIWSPSFRSSP